MAGHCWRAWPPPKARLTIDGKQWGVPYTYYQWGIYYRKDIYEDLGLNEPADFDEMLSNCEAMLASGRKVLCHRYEMALDSLRVGLIISTLRTHGFDFHMQMARRRN